MGLQPEDRRPESGRVRWRPDRSAVTGLVDPFTDDHGVLDQRPVAPPEPLGERLV